MEGALLVKFYDASFFLRRYLSKKLKNILINSRLVRYVLLGHFLRSFHGIYFHTLVVKVLLHYYFVSI